MVAEPNTQPSLLVRCPRSSTLATFVHIPAITAWRSGWVGFPEAQALDKIYERSKRSLGSLPTGPCTPLPLSLQLFSSTIMSRILISRRQRRETREGGTRLRGISSDEDYKQRRERSGGGRGKRRAFSSGVPHFPPAVRRDPLSTLTCAP